MSPRERAARPPVKQSEPPRAGVRGAMRIWVDPRGAILGQLWRSAFPAPQALGTPCSLRGPSIEYPQPSVQEIGGMVRR